MLCFNVDLEIRFNFELGNTERTLDECEFVMVEAVDVIGVKIELVKCEMTRDLSLERYRFIESNEVEDSPTAEEASKEKLENLTNTNALKDNIELLTILN